MPVLPEAHELAKRDICYGYSCSGTWTWARWILFVLFIVGLLILVISAVRINKRRGLEGRAPITGTAWITPPSYYQSQQNQQQQPYVPPYTAEANEQDLGYYDNQGNFHTNSKAQMAQMDGSYRLGTLVPDQTGISAPGPVQTTGQDPSNDFSRQFQRYYGASASSAPPNVNSNEYDEDFTRPAGPPPAHVRS